VASAPDGANVQSSVSAADLAKLKQLADQAVARYNQDKKVAELAEKEAAKQLTAFQKVKSTLEAKVAKGKRLQGQIRSMQDELRAKREDLAQSISAKNLLLEKMRVAQTKMTQTRNELTLAQIEAQKAKVISEKVKLIVSKFKNDAKNATTVADANQIAVEAAAQAAVDIEASSNTIDKIVASKAVDNSVKSLPAIFAVVAAVSVATTFVVYAIRRMRRRGQPPIAPLGAEDPEIVFDFDRILAEIRSQRDAEISVPRKSTTKKVANSKTVVRKAAPKKVNAKRK
jgi:hypothetical protein